MTSEVCPTCQDVLESRQSYITHRQIKHPDEVHTCGFPEDSFACKIRHLQVNSGVAKANASPTDGSRWQRAADVHNNKFG
jgi:hypothetical protein